MFFKAKRIVNDHLYGRYGHTTYIWSPRIYNQNFLGHLGDHITYIDCSNKGSKKRQWWVKSSQCSSGIDENDVKFVYDLCIWTSKITLCPNYYLIYPTGQWVHVWRFEYLPYRKSVKISRKASKLVWKNMPLLRGITEFVNNA